MTANNIGIISVSTISFSGIALWLIWNAYAHNDLTKSELADIVSSEWNWNRPLAYRVKFDRVLLHDGSAGNRQKFFDKRPVYSNKNNRWSILKLHGSNQQGCL
jgi:hypothetical protein